MTSQPLDSTEMFPPDQYELLDFGAGRKLERFGPYVLDRPAPAAEGASQKSGADWPEADARFDRTTPDRGEWSYRRELPERWTVADGRVVMELKPTPFGHLGLFAEQQRNWDWIADRVASARRPPKVLNLFAYTGGSTLAAAAAGAHVVHVDAARNIVQWARRNAELSGLSDAPIRWIAEDAMTFARREVKRGNAYDAVILDPPSYGHGPAGEVWRIAEDLAELVALCGKLTVGRSKFVLLSQHSFERRQVEDLKDTWQSALGASLAVEPMAIRCTDGRPLDAGVVARSTR